MPDANLPETISANVTAALLGRSPRAVARLVADGVLPAGGNHWRRIPVAAIEAITGRPVTAAEYLAARAKASRTRNHPGEQDNRTVPYECPAAA
ncbi:MAG TPA: hypothetical protein VHW66_21850 [Stellaceae bacterium]|nr:hypothetical protein [Stellaceae bacterium]